MSIPRIATVLTALLLLVTLSGCGGSKYAHSTPEELGQSVFAALKAGDKDGIKGMLPSKDDLLKTLDQAEMTDEEKTKIRNEFDAEWENIEKRFQGSIDDNYESARALVQDAELVKVDVGDIALREGFNQVDIEIVVKTGDTERRLEMPRIGEMTSGWVIGPRGFRIMAE